MLTNDKFHQKIRSIINQKLLVIVLGVLFLFVNRLIAQEIILKVAYDDWPPWKIITDKKIGGIDAEILYNIETKSDFKFDFIDAPWRRCIEMLKQGQVDMITSFINNEKRREFTAYIYPYYYTDTARFYGKNNQHLQIEKYEDLYKYRIGCVKGAHYNLRFDQDKRMNKEMVIHEKQMIPMLVSERIDLIIDWEIPFDYLINRMNKKDMIKKYLYTFFLTDNEEVKESASFFAFSKKSKNLKYKGKIESILKTMIKNGEIKKIVSEIVNKNEKKYVDK